jgi:hypothetical protein
VLSGEATANVADLSDLVPAAKISIAGRQLRAFASAADHERIAAALAGDKPAAGVANSPPPAASKLDPDKRYTVTVQNQPAGNIIATVARQLGIQSRYERPIGARLTTKISLSVKDVPLGELMEKTLTPLGLSWRIEGESLVIERATSERGDADGR